MISDSQFMVNALETYYPGYKLIDVKKEKRGEYNF